MRTFLRTAFCVACLGLSSHSFAIYEAEISQASAWLISQQNADGSWGSLPTEQFVATAEAVKALRASGLRNGAYYRGVTWLENHAGDNTDYDVRRAVALNSYGADVGAQWLASLDSAQDTTLPGRDGWGVSAHYIESPLDTALALEGLDRVGTSLGSASVTIQPALDYVKASRITSAGWAVGTQTSSDPFSTALVVKGLVPWLTQDASLSTPINGGISYLQSSVNGSSPIALQALAAHAALLAGNASAANGWLSAIDATQAPNGSWASGRVYDTALAMRAFAAADGLDTSANQTAVSVPDANLRAAINAALGRGALDTLERGELAQLTTLTATNVSIDDLAGLEWAVNLTTLDVRNNNITSTAPVDDLPQLVTLLIDGNPAAGGGVHDFDEDIPTLPEWGMIIMACLLMWQLYKKQREHDNNPTNGAMA
jgi:hypothetical protein